MGEQVAGAVVDGRPEIDAGPTPVIGVFRSRLTTRSIGAALASLLAVAVIAALVVTDEQGRADVRRTDAQVAATSARLHGVRSRLSDTRADLSTAGSERSALGASLATTSAGLSATERQIAADQAGQFDQGIDVGALDSCLTGVEAALDFIAVNRNADVARRRSGASPRAAARRRPPDSVRFRRRPYRGPPRRPRWKEAAVAIVTGCVATALVAGLVDDIRVQQHRHDAEVRLSGASADLTSTDRTLQNVTTELRQAISARNVEQVHLDQVAGQLTAAKHRLSQAAAGETLEGLALATASQCLHGVQRALDAVQFGDDEAATGDLAVIAPACRSALGSASTGPVYPFDFADPSILVAGTTYFAYGTNSATGNVQVLESADLDSWRPVGDAFPHLPSWASPGYTWAPAVVRVGSSYRLYYAAAVKGTEELCISVASAETPEGPFTDKSRAPLVCQRTLDGSIDPDPFVDTTGHLHLSWKSNGAGGQPSEIWAQPLQASGTALAPGAPSPLLVPSQPWEGGVVEAPQMVDQGGTFTLLYSGNNWNTGAYAIGLATCAGPLGPCRKPRSQPLYASQPTLVGPGSPAVFVDASGSLQIAFDAWLPSAVGYPHTRLLFLRHLLGTGGALQVGPAG